MRRKPGKMRALTVKQSPPSAGKKPFEPPPGLGPYRIEKPVGRGGMAVVYLAKDIRSGRNVALKLMDPSLSDDAQFVQRFEQEALACEDLKHPNIVDVYSHGETAGWHFLAAEFVDGGTVAQLLSQVGALPVEVVAELAAQALSGLAYAHERGIVHRDLKPENLLLTTQGALKIGDFGIARTTDQAHLTKTGMLMGTAEYMSPEQAKGQEVDGRSDLFSVGSNLYEMLTTQNPFHSDNPAASLVKIMTHQYVPLSLEAPAVPAWLEQFIERLLAAEPSGRFANAREAYAELEPQISERRRLNPTFLLEFLRKPQDMKAQLAAQASTLLTTEARALVDAADPLLKNQAVVKAQLALAIDPTNREARFHLDKLKRSMPVTQGPSSNPKVLELERSVAEQPSSPALVQQLALAYRAEGSLLKAAAMLRRYLSLKPGDALVVNSLMQLTGEKLAVQAQGPLNNRIPKGSAGGLKSPLSNRIPGQTSAGQKVASSPNIPAAARMSNPGITAVRSAGAGLPVIKDSTPPLPAAPRASSTTQPATPRPSNAMLPATPRPASAGTRTSGVGMGPAFRTSGSGVPAVRSSGSSAAAQRTPAPSASPVARAQSSGAMPTAQRPRNAPSLSMTAAGKGGGGASASMGLWLLVVVLLLACAGVAWTLAGRPPLNALLRPPGPVAAPAPPRAAAAQAPAQPTAAQPRAGAAQGSPPPQP